MAGQIWSWGRKDEDRFCPSYYWRMTVATCPKCGKPAIKKRRGERACKRCGPLQQPITTETNHGQH